MTFHLMIVDDEPTIRKGLSNFIKWDTLDSIVDATACDGAEAMELIRLKQPDIVITDIRMPQVDGIALAKFIYEEYPQIKVILLTGYADFQYAQSAICYAVSDFLLKPTSKDKLIEAVKKAQAAIAELRNRTVIQKEDFSYLQEQYLAEVTSTLRTDIELLERSSNYKIELDRYYAAAFQINAPHNQVNEHDISALKSILAGQSETGYVYGYENRLLIWLYRTELADTRRLQELRNTCDELLSSMQSLYDIRLNAGISLPHRGLGELSAAAIEAIGALNMNFYNNSSISVFETRVEREYFDTESEFTMELYHFENMMKEWAFEDARKWIHVLFSRLRVNLTRSFDVKSVCVQIYYICSRILIKKNLIPPSPAMIEQLQSCTTLSQLEDNINHLFDQVTEMLANKGMVLSPLIEKAMIYIHSHLDEALSLETIADYVHVNPTHLSRTFKKECGESITEFINKVRIEKAQELLSFSNTLAYEVAEKVGFNDPSYFSSIFKKYTGLSPKEFKQMHSI